MAIKYVIVSYKRANSKNQELFDTLSEAIDAKRHLQALQPENYYEVEEVEV